jgi:pre-mRNA-splicing factor RBM22/SLT11
MAPGVQPPDGRIPSDMPAHMVMPMPAPSVVGVKVKYASQDPSAMGSVSKKDDASK